MDEFGPGWKRIQTLERSFGKFKQAKQYSFTKMWSKRDSHVTTLAVPTPPPAV